MKNIFFITIGDDFVEIYRTDKTGEITIIVKPNGKIKIKACIKIP